MELTSFAGVLSLATAFITFYIQSKKAGKSDVNAMAKRIVDLEKTDKNLQLELNEKEIQLAQVKFKAQALEDRLRAEDKIEGALETLVEGNIAILETLQGADVEVVKEEE